jgi:hypothetical protein
MVINVRSPLITEEKINQIGSAELVHCTLVLPSKGRVSDSMQIRIKREIIFDYWMNN